MTGEPKSPLTTNQSHKQKTDNTFHNKTMCSLISIKMTPN